MELAADAREGERDVGAVDKGDGVHHQCDGDDAGPAGRGGLSGGWSGRDVCGGEGLRGGVHRPRFTQVAPSIATEKRAGWMVSRFEWRQVLCREQGVMFEGDAEARTISVTMGDACRPSPKRFWSVSY